MARGNAHIKREAMEIRRIGALGIRMGDYTNSRGGEHLVWAEGTSISIQALAEEVLVLVDHCL
jgi:urease accessory protein UreE